MSDKETRILKASHLLQSKVGRGTIDENKIKKSQKIMDNMGVDFVPMAEEYLTQLEQALEKVRSGAIKDDKKAINAMAAPVMELKGNAAMFDYALVGGLASVMLNFLETLETVDNDVVDIVDAHMKTLRLLINNGMKGDGGTYGAQLQGELKDACRRYFAKKASNRRPAGDDDAFFIDG